MRYVAFFTLICVLLSFQLLPAQAPDTLWTRTYGDIGGDWCSSVQQTADGGFIMAGTGRFNHWDYSEGWLIKTNAYGDVQWIKSDSTYGCHMVLQTSDMGYVILGNHASEVGTWTNYNILFIKTDINGDTIWTKSIDKGFGELGKAILQTLDGGFIVVGKVGFSDTLNITEDDLFLIKIDSNGDTVWTKKYGGQKEDRGWSIQQTSDSGYVILGETESVGAGNSDLWLIKTDVNGDEIWTRTYGKLNREYGNNIQLTSDGGYIILGGTDSNELWLIKTDANGDSIWTRSFDGPGPFGKVLTTADGGYIIMGNVELRVWLIKTDANGDTIWTRSFNGFGSDIQHTSDGGYIIGGSIIRNDDTDFYLMKISTDPSFINIQRTLRNTDFRLYHNYPNPFNPSTTIEFKLPKTSNVTLKIFNILGEEVATLVSDRLTAGSYAYDWDASNLASGVYLYRLEAGDFVETRKMILMR